MARWATLTLAVSPSSTRPVSTRKGSSEVTAEQPLGEGGGDQAAGPGQAPVDRRVEDGEGQLHPPPVGMVDVDEGAQGLLGQVAAGSRAEGDDGPAGDVAGVQRDDAIAPLPRVDGQVRGPVRVETGGGRSGAEPVEGFLPHLLPDHGRVVEAADIGPVGVHCEPGQDHRPAGLGRVGEEIVGVEAEAALVGHDPRVAPHLGLDQERVEVGQLGRRAAVGQLVGVGEEGVRQLDHRVGRRRRVHPDDGRQHRHQVGHVGQGRRLARDRPRQRGRVDPPLAEEPEAGGEGERGHAREAQPEPVVHPFRGEQLLEHELGEELGQQLPVGPLPAVGVEAELGGEVDGGHVVAHDGSEPPKVWNTLRDRTGSTSRPQTALRMTALR